MVSIAKGLNSYLPGFSTGCLLVVASFNQLIKKNFTSVKIIGPKVSFKQIFLKRFLSNYHQPALNIPLFSSNLTPTPCTEMLHRLLQLILHLTLKVYRSSAVPVELAFQVTP